jgi:hypothetical protein
MGRPKGSKNKTTKEKAATTGKNIVAPIVPATNTTDDDYLDPLEQLWNLKLEDINVPTFHDKVLIERLSSHQLSPDEICAVLDISRSRYDASLAMQQAYQRGQAIGRASLRRMQWMTAPRSALMQIWLGKQHLGQTDKLETKKDTGERDEARQAFENKLKSIIDVTPTGLADEAVDPGRAGGGELLLEVMGEGQPNRAHQAVVVEAREYPEIS